jgi:hypothetical protein
MFSSAKIRYFEDGEYDEETDDVTGLGLQMQGSSSQLKYKYLGELIVPSTLKQLSRWLVFRMFQGYASVCSFPSNDQRRL